ncbi:MAG: DUF3488 domain-containing protein [Silvanigrellales bacterium]|nr:DUF3488 domain-containing protein [Silvanigrellales bacterium]
MVVLAVEEPDDGTIIGLAVAHAMLSLLVLVWREDTTGDPRASRESLVSVLVLFAPVTAVVVVTFTLMPGLARRLFRPPPFVQSGFDFGAEMRPGDVASVALSTDVAFRAYFRDGVLPSQERLYWRGAAYGKSEGLHWKLGLVPRAESSDAGFLRLAEGELTLRQEIVVEPRPTRLVFALDWPYGVVVAQEDDDPSEGGGERIQEDDQGDSESAGPQRIVRLPGNMVLPPSIAPRRRLLASVTSAASPRLALTQTERRAYLDVPFAPPPSLLPWVEGFRARAHSFRALEAFASTKFQSEGFVYTLQPGKLAEATPQARLEAFLTQSRRGFCEHYAGALGTLFRWAGIPARVVVGYQGGVRNTALSVVTVRDAEAHAWVEAFDDSLGRWRRFDATAWVAADRISGLPDDSLAGADATRWTREATQTLAQWTEPLRTLYAFAVAGFRERSSMRLAKELIVAAWKENAFSLLVTLAGVTGLGYAAVVLVRRSGQRRGRDVDALLFEAYRTHLRKAGVNVHLWQGPSDLSEQAALLFPQNAHAIRETAKLLSHLLYDRLTEAHRLRARKETKRALKGMLKGANISQKR